MARAWATRKGFGHIVIERMVAQQVDGTVEMASAPEGLSWVLEIPHSHFTADSARRGGAVAGLAGSARRER